MRNLMMIVLLAGTAAPAAAQTQIWIRQFGFGELNDDRANALAPNIDGGAFVAGQTQDFTVSPPNFPHLDLWVARHDSGGNQLWIRRYGGAGDEYAQGLASDGEGGVFVAGTVAPQYTAWLAHYDNAGHQTWQRSLGSSREALALAPDGAGGTIVAGWIATSIQAWIARYDGAGNQQWFRQIQHGVAYALTPDGAGGAFVAGYDNAPDRGWMARYDGAGNRQWIKPPGTIPMDVARALATDGAGGVYVAGHASPSPNEAVLARYDGAGTQLWVRHIGATGSNFVRGLAADGAGGVLVAGSTSDSFGGPHAGNGDAYVARYDSTGFQTWVHQFGTGEQDSARAVAPSALNGFFAAGSTLGSLAGTGTYDAWLARYGPSPCPADFNQDGGVDGADVEAFFVPWEAGENVADVNRDGGVDGQDVEYFFVRWEAGGC